MTTRAPQDKPHLIAPELTLREQYAGRPLTQAALLDVHTILLPAITAAAAAYDSMSTRDLRTTYTMAHYDFLSERTNQSWLNMLVLGALLIQRPPEAIEPARESRR
jgi:hypothetical protein